MIFTIDMTRGDVSTIAGVHQIEAHYIDYRTVSTLVEAIGCHWYPQWLEWNTNHREVYGMVAGDRKRTTTINIIDLSAEELISFIRDSGENVIVTIYGDNHKPEYVEADIVGSLEIYNDYRE